MLPIFAGGYLLMLGLTSVASGQKLPEPEEIPLETKDGVLLQCTWFAGKDKNSAPIIMMHDWGGTGREYFSLAKFFQSKGNAVIVPDLRGHGGSTQRKGRPDLDLSRMAKEDLAMMEGDIEACKKFLKEQNNLGKCNIELLTIVAAGATCIPAVSWSIKDWSYPPIGGKKQGQDVKALVMLSPAMNFKGLAMNRILTLEPISSKRREPLSIMIGYGTQDTAGRKDAKSIYSLLERNRIEPRVSPSLSSREQMAEMKRRKNLFLEQYPVSLRGTKLIQVSAKLTLARKIADFIDARLVEQRDNFPWQDRS